MIPPVFQEADVLEQILAKVSKGKGIRGEKPAVDKQISLLVEKKQRDSADLHELVKLLLNAESLAVIMGMDLVQRSDGHRALFAIAGLTYVLEARLFLLSGRPNEQGLIDMGCVPDMLPGSRPLHVGDFKHKFEDMWKDTVPTEEGLSLMEMIEAIRRKEIKALYVHGENPVVNLPDANSIREALKSLDFLIVQDIFLTETAGLADVVFPALGWTEKDGTYTNLERRVQLLKRAVNSSSGLEDWKIFSEISNKMGYTMEYKGAENIMEEIAEVSPLYRDLTYREIRTGKCLWPYHGEPLRGEIHEVQVTKRSQRDFTADLYLVPENLLFHSGTLSRRSPALRKICPEAVLKISQRHSEIYGLNEGDSVQISTEKGSMVLPVSVEETLQGNRVLLSNHFEGKGVLGLLSYTLDA
jgi:formate dehydrogenase major subunit/formate dehydrogenase alpha subunit